jgi:hypothetical protein
MSAAPPQLRALRGPLQLPHTGSTQSLRRPCCHQVLAPRPRWRWRASSSTILQAHMLHHQQWSSGATTSISSSSPLSTCHLTEGGSRTALVGHQCRQPHTRAHQRHRAHHRQYAQQVSLQRICGLKSSVAALVRTATSPSSASEREALTSTVTSVWWTTPL